jgi:hypothetical protein
MSERESSFDPVVRLLIWNAGAFTSIDETEFDRVSSGSPERKIGSAFGGMVAQNVGIGGLHLAI